MAELPAKESRASATGFDVFEYRSSVVDGWAIREWRLKARGVSVADPLEHWWSPADDVEPVIGRVRIKRGDPGTDLDLGDLVALVADASPRPGITEILNLELEPAFLGQRLGHHLLVHALHEVPGDDIVVCEPVATEYWNIAREASSDAVHLFYEGIGLAADHRVPGYLAAVRSDLVL